MVAELGVRRSAGRPQLQVGYRRFRESPLVELPSACTARADLSIYDPSVSYGALMGPIHYARS
jgi:hypothetical protein